MTWIVGKLDTSTIDFYFRSRSDVFPMLTLVDVAALSDDTHPFWAGKNDLVVLVRDVPIRYLERLKSSRQHRQIVWFIDDDIPVVVDDKTLPKEYRNRLSSWYCQAYSILGLVCHDIWVSTPYLANKYQLPERNILPPLQVEQERGSIRCFYHGSASHTLEWQFVVSFIEQIQAKYQNTWFELIGDHALYKRVRHIPRVTVLHPMSWSNYQAHIGTRTMDIGLAPLFDSQFNNARSHCKLLDIQRQGAVGIFSARFPYSAMIKAHHAGWVADDTMADWLRAFDTAMASDRQAVFARSLGLPT